MSSDRERHSRKQLWSWLSPVSSWAAAFGCAVFLLSGVDLVRSELEGARHKQLTANQELEVAWLQPEFMLKKIVGLETMMMELASENPHDLKTREMEARIKQCAEASGLSLREYSLQSPVKGAYCWEHRFEMFADGDHSNWVGFMAAAKEESIPFVLEDLALAAEDGSGEWLTGRCVVMVCSALAGRIPGGSRLLR